MNESIGFFMKAGFPLLLVMLVIMILVSVWRNNQLETAKKRKWTAVVLVPILVAGLIFWQQNLYPATEPVISIMLSALMLILPVTGIFIWLVGSR